MFFWCYVSCQVVSNSRHVCVVVWNCVIAQQISRCIFWCDVMFMWCVWGHSEKGFVSFSSSISISRFLFDFCRVLFLLITDVIKFRFVCIDIIAFCFSRIVMCVMSSCLDWVTCGLCGWASCLQWAMFRRQQFSVFFLCERLQWIASQVYLWHWSWIKWRGRQKCSIAVQINVHVCFCVQLRVCGCSCVWFFSGKLCQFVVLRVVCESVGVLFF